MDLNLTLCIGTRFHEINPSECLITRIIGSIILFISIFSIIFNIRFIYWSSYHRYVQSGHYSLILSMIFSSISVIIIISPSIFIQCFACYRLCSRFYCQIEGFISYLNGYVHMFMLMMISIIRYITVLQINIKNRFIDRHSNLTVMICWLFGLIFALPPLFNLNKYIPEGIGFHCGLNWFDQSISSRIYFILVFIFVYFIPLIILFIVNIYVFCTIRRLLDNARIMTKSNILLNVLNRKHQTNSYPSSSSGSTTIQSEKLGFIIPANSVNGNFQLVVRQKTSSLQMNHLMRLNRLKADRRFALATIFLVSEYLLSWTPYAIIALCYLFNMKFVSQQSILMTISAFIAKISMILNPFIYIVAIKTNQLKSILCYKKCLCSYCRIRRNIVTL